MDNKIQRITREQATKNSKGEIRTLDLTGMSRALSPTELPCHEFEIFNCHKVYFYINKIKIQALCKSFVTIDKNSKYMISFG